MNENLYPLKFRPILKSKIWGGNKLEQLLHKKPGNLPNIGESWEISGYNNEVSVVSNGFLEGNKLEELVEVYMGDLTGEVIFEQFGIQFPLLIKFIEAKDLLSIQVHPGDEYAVEHYNSYGKTEMWYVIQADPGAELISGFKKDTAPSEYQKALESGKLKELLNYEKVEEGDLFFIPAGRVHALGSGILLTEIQQTSDLTFRIYDWDRMGDDGKPRKIHAKEAIDVMDFGKTKNAKTSYQPILNKTTKLIGCEYFTTNLVWFDKQIEKDYISIDSFVIYICIKGSFLINYGNEEHVRVDAGDTILIPAVLKNVLLIPEAESKLLEVYIAENQ